MSLRLGGIIATGVIWSVQLREGSQTWLIPICTSSTDYKAHHTPLADTLTFSGLQFLGPIAILGLYPFCVESPRWLVEKGRDDEAVAVVHRLRGGKVDAAAEVAEMRVAYETDKALHSGVEWVELFRGSNLRRTLISMGLQCLQQAQGISFMANYLLVTFISLGFQDVYMLLFAVRLSRLVSALCSTLADVTVTLQLGCMMLGLSFFGFVLPDLLGRRTLLLSESHLRVLAVLGPRHDH